MGWGLWRTVSLLIVAAWIGDVVCWADGGAVPEEQMMFDSGKKGYPRYRIPALILTKQGTVLAFCEGRKDGRGLTGNIDLVVKRSSDHGKTWSSLQVVSDDGANTLGNPCPVIDQSTGTIWLPFTRSRGEDLESEIVVGASKERTRVFVTKSDDDGLTWAKPVEITASVKKPAWTWYGTGPGVGIQLKSGRLLIPSYHAVEKTGIYRSHSIWSDDHGKTWQLGGVVGDNTSESHVVERRDGSIYLSTRTVVGKELRTIASSKNGGKTWSAQKFDSKLYDSHCQACVIALPNDKSTEKPRWLYSYPSGPGRRNMVIRMSHDEGRTWPIGRQLTEGDSQYSSMVLLGDGAIGILFERWRDRNYRIYFTRFSLDWLTAKPWKK